MYLWIAVELNLIVFQFDSVSCTTVSGDIDVEADIAVRVMGADGNPQDSTGDVVFTYRVGIVNSAIVVFFLLFVGQCPR